MSSKKTYIVFRCSNCGFYSMASTNQKTRLCVRCGKTMTLGDTYNRSAADFNEAQRMVGELNSKRDSETLDRKERTQNFPVKSDLGADPVKTSSKGLLRTFQEIIQKCGKREVNILEILDACETSGVPREYAQKLIKELVESGQAYEPARDKIAFL